MVIKKSSARTELKRKSQQTNIEIGLTSTQQTWKLDSHHAAAHRDTALQKID